MTVVRLLLDEMISPKVAAQLRDRGHEVYAIAERADLVALPDDEVLALGAVERRIVVTLNIGDFAILDGRWRSQGRTHGGLSYVATSAFPQDRAFVGALVASLDGAARAGELPGQGEARFLTRRKSSAAEKRSER